MPCRRGPGQNTASGKGKNRPEGVVAHRGRCAVSGGCANGTPHIERDISAPRAANCEGPMAEPRRRKAIRRLGQSRCTRRWAAPSLPRCSAVPPEGLPLSGGDRACAGRPSWNNFGMKSPFSHFHHRETLLQSPAAARQFRTGRRENHGQLKPAAAIISGRDKHPVECRQTGDHRDRRLRAPGLAGAVALEASPQISFSGIALDPNPTKSQMRAPKHSLRTSSKNKGAGPATSPAGAALAGAGGSPPHLLHLKPARSGRPTTRPKCFPGGGT